MFNLKFRSKQNFVLVSFSSVILLLSNLFVIAFGIINSWDLFRFTYLFFFQTIIIGVFQFLKVISLKNFSTDGFTSLGLPIAVNKRTKAENAIYMLSNYIFLMFIYFLVIYFTINKSPVFDAGFFICCGILFGNHAVSFVLNFKKDRSRMINLGVLVTIPYLRVIPMNIALIAGVLAIRTGLIPATVELLIPILLLKTVLDYASHILEHDLEAG